MDPLNPGTQVKNPTMQLPQCPPLGPPCLPQGLSCMANNEIRTELASPTGLKDNRAAQLESTTCSVRQISTIRALVPTGLPHSPRALHVREDHASVSILV